MRGDITLDSDGDRWLDCGLVDIPLDLPPVEWRHDGTGNLILAGGMCWRRAPRFKLEFGYGRLEHLEAGRRRALDWDPDGERWPHSQASWFNRVIASLLKATEEAEAWRRMNPMAAV